MFERRNFLIKYSLDNIDGCLSFQKNCNDNNLYLIEIITSIKKKLNMDIEQHQKLLQY